MEQAEGRASHERHKRAPRKTALLEPERSFFSQAGKIGNEFTPVPYRKVYSASFQSGILKPFAHRNDFLHCDLVL